MAKRDLPTPEELRQLLRYEPETGKLFWLERPASFFKTGRDDYTPDRSAKSWNKRYAGKEALTARHPHTGHMTGRLLSRVAFSHRVAWALHVGRWPDGEVDHIDGNPENNRASNPREVSRTENARNRARQHDNTSGTSGVSWHARIGAWQVRIGHLGKRIHLGYFENREEAVAARIASEAALGYHVNHGRNVPLAVQHYAVRRRGGRDGSATSPQ